MSRGYIPRLPTSCPRSTIFRTSSGMLSARWPKTKNVAFDFVSSSRSSVRSVLRSSRFSKRYHWPEWISRLNALTW